MRFPRTIRLDGSDERVYERPAQPGEWAVTGGFAFADAEPGTLSGKAAQAFANGMLGTESFGWSTLVVVSDISEAEYDAVVARLAGHLAEVYSAPSPEAAWEAARAEAEFAASLCGHAVNTLLTVERSFGDDGVVERFRVVTPPTEALHAKVWEIVGDDGDG